MLVMLSSGATPRYRDDIIRSLALPPGGELQFRYDRRYICPKLLDRITAGSVRNEPALVVYLWADKDTLHTELVPCRSVTVATAGFTGSSCIVRFRAENFIDGLNDATFRVQLKDEEKALLPKWETKAGVGPVLSGKFFLSIEADFRANVTNDFAAFERTAIELVKHKDFGEPQNATFYTVCGVTHASRANRKVSPTVHASDARYELASGRRYEIDVYSFVPPKIELKPSQLHIATDVKAVEFPLGDFRDIDSRYDIKRFRFQVAQQIQTVSAGVRLYVTGPDQRGPHADILIPVQFKGSLALALMRAFFIAIGTSGPEFSQQKELEP